MVLDLILLSIHKNHYMDEICTRCHFQTKYPNNEATPLSGSKGRKGQMQKTLDLVNSINLTIFHGLFSNFQGTFYWAAVLKLWSIK